METLELIVGGKLIQVAEIGDACIVYGGPDHATPGRVIERQGPGSGRADQIRRDFDHASVRGLAWLRSLRAGR